MNVILLDLNHTFVANSPLTWRPGHPNVAEETYRTWLLPLFKAIDAYVILVTVRDDKLRTATLERIAQLTAGWAPDEAYFKPAQQRYLTAPVYKERILLDHILPARGHDTLYLALESNDHTRAMYGAHGIKAVRVPIQSWDNLPTMEPRALPALRSDLVVLLDLNYTLVGNSPLTFHMVNPRIADEVYRQWLVELLRPVHVALITTRSDDLRQQTLARIQRLTDWLPASWYFKPSRERFAPAQDFKRSVVLGAVIPAHGPDTPYVALESNPATRAMYASIGIQAWRVPDTGQWAALPAGAPPAPMPGYQLNLF